MGANHLSASLKPDTSQSLHILIAKEITYLFHRKVGKIKWNSNIGGSEEEEDEYEDEDEEEEDEYEDEEEDEYEDEEKY